MSKVGVVMCHLFFKFRIYEVTQNSEHYQQEHAHWIALSDLMTGLMMLFLLIAVAYMVKVDSETKKIKEIAVLYEKLKVELYDDLEHEFRNDLPTWGAELERDLTLRFKEPEVLFATGRDELKPRFQEILDDFFPRYMNILTSQKYRDSIAEIRIEGHTSSFWSQSSPEQYAYIRNMELSQARTRTTLGYVMNLQQVKAELPWLRQHLTANGLSWSKRILDSEGRENFARSQRVEFRVRTDSDSRIARILEASQ